MTTAGSGTSVPVPLKNGTWDQPADSWQTLIGTISITAPATCGGGGGLTNQFIVDGTVGIPLITALTPVALGTTITQPLVIIGSGGLAWNFVFPAPAAATQHTITLTATDNCSGANENYTVNAIKLNVYGSTS